MGFWNNSGISWTIFKQSAPRSRQNTSSLNFYRPDALPDAQPTVSSLKANLGIPKNEPSKVSFPWAQGSKWDGMRQYAIQALSWTGRREREREFIFYIATTLEQAHGINTKLGGLPERHLAHKAGHPFKAGHP